MSAEHREQDIKVMQGELDGKKVEVKGKRGGVWRAKDEGVAFNFQEYDYRIAPDVVYKVACLGEDLYLDNLTSAPAGATVTKGYWVEGEV